MTTRLNDCEYYMGCEMWPCHNRAKYSIGRDGAPKSQWTHICDDCAQELFGHMESRLRPERFVHQEIKPLPFEDGPEPEDVEYEDMTNAELHELLEEIGVVNISKKTKKEELVKILKDAESHESE